MIFDYHFKKVDNLIWILLSSSDDGTTATWYSLEAAERFATNISDMYKLPVTIKDNDRYQIELKFDNEADEAEFIMKYSDGIGVEI